MSIPSCRLIDTQGSSDGDLLTFQVSRRPLPAHFALTAPNARTAPTALGEVRAPIAIAKSASAVAARYDGVMAQITNDDALATWLATQP